MNDLTKQLADALEEAHSILSAVMSAWETASKEPSLHATAFSFTQAMANGPLNSIPQWRINHESALAAYRAQGEAKYRMLERGELVLPGDEVEFTDGEWAISGNADGSFRVGKNNFHYRRPITEGRV